MSPPTSQAPIGFEPPAGESLSLLELPCAEPSGLEPGLAGVGARRFELSCRGDRVPLALLSPANATGTLLVQPPPHAGTPLAELPGLGAWLSAGVAVASISVPLFGARRSPKLTAKLERAVEASAAGGAIAPTDRILWAEFTRQAVLELRRALDALSEIGAPDPRALAAGGLAANAGAILCAVDERPRGAVLASLGCHGPDEIEPGRYLDRVDPRRVHRIEAGEADLLEAAWPLLSPLFVKRP